VRCLPDEEPSLYEAVLEVGVRLLARVDDEVLDPYRSLLLSM
jgi:hypothetical protein